MYIYLHFDPLEWLYLKYILSGRSPADQKAQGLWVQDCFTRYFIDQNEFVCLSQVLINTVGVFQSPQQHPKLSR